MAVCEAEAGRLKEVKGRLTRRGKREQGVWVWNNELM